MLNCFVKNFCWQFCKCVFDSSTFWSELEMKFKYYLLEVLTNLTIKFVTLFLVLDRLDQVGCVCLDLFYHLHFVTRCIMRLPLRFEYFLTHPISWSWSQFMQKICIFFVSITLYRLCDYQCSLKIFNFFFKYNYRKMKNIMYMCQNLLYKWKYEYIVCY